MLFLLCENYGYANNLVSILDLRRSHAQFWEYLHDGNQLRGFASTDATVVRYGAYYRNPRYDQIMSFVKAGRFTIFDIRDAYIHKGIDGKFSTDGVNIFNTVSGEPIPEDEPLMLLRARDVNALAAMVMYYNECKENGCNPLHMLGIQNRIDKFRKFSVDHPERMKEPGVTKHLKL